MSACLACLGALLAGCGGATFQGDGDGDGGEGASGGKGGSSGGKGGGSGSSGSAGKSSGGSSGTASGGGGGATGGSGARAGSGGGGASGSGAASGSGGSGNTGNVGGTGAEGGSGNTGNAGGTSGSGGSGAASTEQWAADYDQSCEFDGSCSLVPQGDKCACPACQSGAVNNGVFDQYQQDWQDIMCPMGDPVCPQIACERELPACTEKGKCYARPPTYIDAANYPQTCEQPSDCHTIFTGEVCSSCQCATAAVNSEGYERYRADVEAVDCTPAPSDCDCAPQVGVTCLIDLMSGTGRCVTGIAAEE